VWLNSMYVFFFPEVFNDLLSVLHCMLELSGATPYFAMAAKDCLCWLKMTLAVSSGDIRVGDNCIIEKCILGWLTMGCQYLLEMVKHDKRRILIKLSRASCKL
jgi:hypothetical protein